MDMKNPEIIYWRAVLLLTILSCIVKGDVSINATCASIGSSLTVTAEYTGTETLGNVIWYIDTSLGLTVVTGTCSTFGTPASAFPSTRMTYACPSTLGTSKYSVTISNLELGDIGKVWGVDFTLTTGSGSTIDGRQQKTITGCPTPTSPGTTTTTSTTTPAAPMTTTATPPPTTTIEAGDNSPTTLIIVLSVVGGVFILGILGTLLVLYLRKRPTDTPMKDSSAGRKNHEKSRKQLRRTPMDKDFDTLEDSKTHDQYRAYNQYQMSPHYWVPDQNRVHGRQPETQYRMYGKQPINRYPMYGRQPGIQYQMYGRQSRIHETILDSRQWPM